MLRIIPLKNQFLFILLMLCAVPSFSEDAQKNPPRDAVWVNQVFQKGKVFYEAGNYSSALREWKQLDPYLDQYPSFQKVIGYLRNQVNPDTESQKSEPADSSIRVAMQKGRVAYENGDWKTALEAWNRVERYLDPSSEDYAKLQKLKRDYETAQIAKKQNSENAGQATSAVPVPSKFGGYLDDASDRLQKQILEVQSRQENLEKESVFEQAWIETTFSRGQEAYEEGNYDLAIEEWDKISFKMKDQLAFASQVEQVKQASRSFRKAELDYAAAANKVRDAQNPAATEMQRFFTQASSELRARADQASRQGSEKQQSNADQQRRVDETFENGKALYVQGKHQEALNEWLLLTSYFEGDPVTKSAFLSTQGSLQAYQNAQSNYQSAVNSGAYKLRLPDGFFRYVETANHELSAGARQAEAEREKTEQAVASKRSELLLAFEKGKDLYAQGRVSDAVIEWRKVTPWIENGEEVRKELDGIDASSTEASRQKTALKDAKAKALDTYALPAEFETLLNAAQEDLKNQATAATNERLLMQQNQNDKQARISNVLYKASLAYKAGKVDQAVDEWEKLLPYLDPGAEERALIESVRQNYTEYTTASKKNQEIRDKTDVKIGLPEDLKLQLVKTNEELIKNAAQARARQQSGEAELRERQTVVVSAVENGKVLYQTGRLDQAIHEWEKLTPYLDPMAEEKLLLESLKQSNLDALEASRQLGQVSAKRRARVEVPEDLKKILSQASLDLQGQAMKARAERESTETSFNERQTQMLSTLEKARVYTQAGRIPEAIEEWKKIADSFEESSNARALVRDLETSFLQYKLAKQSLDEAMPKRDQKFPTPDGMKALFEDAQAKVAAETQVLQTTRANMEKAIVDRQAFVDETFASGKKLAAEGKWLEAVYEWEDIVPYLDEKSDVQQLLLSAKKQWQILQDTKQSNELFITTRYKDNKMPFAEELDKLLTGLNEDVQKSLVNAQANRAAMEKSLAERQAWVGSTFEKGKAYYEVGKYKEALEFWGSLAPNLKDEPAVQSMLAGLPLKYEAMVHAEKTAQEAEMLKKEPLAPPAGMQEILAAAAQKLSAVSMEAMTRAEKAHAEGSARSNAVNQFFNEGQAFAEKGQWEAAIKAWAGLPPYLADSEKIKATVDNLSASYQNYTRSLADAQQAETQLNTRLTGPADLSLVLSEAAFKLDKERQATELARERTDKILAEKKTAVDRLYAEGKVFYDQGKLPDAFSAWRSMLPSVDNEKSLEELLAKADQSYQMYASSKEQNQLSMARKELKLDAPAELSQMLETVNQQLRDQVFDLKSRASQTEKMLAERKDWIEVTFQKGRLAYSQGRYQEAAAEWKTMLPFIENGSALENGILDFERNLQVSLEASKTNMEAEAKKNMKFPAPDELGVLLVQLNEKVKNEALEASGEKIRADQQSSERQKWLKQTFELGKSFYHEAKYDQAIAEWEKLAPYLEAQTGTLQLIDAVKQGYQESVGAKKAALEAAAGDYQGLKLPYADQMSQLLVEADTKLREEASAARAKTGEMQKTLAERQEWGTTTFNKGKLYFDESRHEEALDQWERLLPYLAEGSDLKRQINSLRESLNTIALAQNMGGGSAGGETAVKLKNEDEILGVLEAANQKFKEEVENARAKGREAQQSLDQRKQWMEATFQKGKTFYDENNYTKAVEEWGVLGPYLGEHPQIREMIEEAKKNYSEGRYAQQIIESMEARKATLTPLPEQAQPANEPVEAAAQPGEVQEVDESKSEGEELISGEIVSIDESARTITMMLFNESGAN